MKQVIKKLIFILLVVLLMPLSIISCGQDDENTINIYSAIEEDEIEGYIKDFKDKYPEIKVNIVRDSGGVASAKLLVEKDNPRADVVWGIPASNALILDKYGLFLPYKSERLDDIEEEFYDTKNEIPHWVGLNAWMTAIIANITELEEKGLPIPESYEDLLNPAYKDSMIMPNPASSGTGFLTVSAWIQLMGDSAWNYMDNLNLNIAEYSHSGSAPAKQTAQGEFIVGIGMDYIAEKLAKDNTHIRAIMPKEGSGWELEVLALVNKKDVKDSAKKFYEWALSDDAMMMYAKNRSLVTTKGSTSKEVRNQMIENDFNWASENRNDILNKWEERYGVGE